MVQKSGVHQLRLVVYPMIYRVLAPSQVVVWEFFHQQYFMKREGYKVYFIPAKSPSNWRGTAPCKTLNLKNPKHKTVYCKTWYSYILHIYVYTYISWNFRSWKESQQKLQLLGNKPNQTLIFQAQAQESHETHGFGRGTLVMWKRRCF